MLSEQDYPIQKYWLLKPLITLFLFLILFHVLYNIRAGIPVLAFSRMDLLFLAGAIFLFSFPVFIVCSLKFSLQEDAMLVKQGILNLKQGNFFYAKIQDISIQQGFIDRLLGLYTLYIENAASAKSKTAPSFYTTILIGLCDSRVSIPGLKEKAALSLKEELLNRSNKAKAPSL